MTIIHLNFREHPGDGGHSRIFKWTWVVRTRIYIWGHWTPFMYAKYNFK